MIEMTINSKLLTKLIEVIARRVLKKKLGKDATLDIRKISVVVNDGKTEIGFDGNVTANTKDLLKLIEKET